MVIVVVCVVVVGAGAQTPVLWLCQQLAYPDGYVHVCIRPAPPA